MIKINPLYILILITAVIAMLVIQNSRYSETLKVSNKNIEILEKKGQKLTQLKEHWEHKDSMGKVQRILKNQKLTDAQIELKEDGNKIIISSKGVDANALDALTSLILNDTLVIKGFELERKTQLISSFSMEIAK